MQIRLGLTAALVATLALAGCQPQVQRAPCPAGEVCLEYGNNTEPLTLDPHKSNLVDEFTIIGDLIQGLTTDAPDATPAPGMAERWEVTPDGLTWTFHLRRAQWSDGAPVTADDFVYSLRRILDPKTASIYAYLVYIVKNGQAMNEGKAPPEALGARAPDPHTLVLTLEHPAPYLPELTKHVSFFPVPKHVVERLGDAWVRPQNFVGNGPYRLVAWTIGRPVQVVKNARYWEAEKVCVDRINYYPTPDSVSAERQIERGELDVNTLFQSNRIGRLRERIPAYVRTNTILATSYLSFNTRDVAAFRDLRVRRALSESIDRDFITGKLLRAGQTPAYAFVPKGTANYKVGPKTVWADLPFAARQAQARALLAAAGYGPKRPLKIEIKASASPDTLLAVQAIQADWKAVGVQASVVQNESQVAFAAYRTRDFQIGGVMSWYADFNDPITFLQLLKSDTGAQNYGDYRNPRFDALMDAADREPDTAARARLLAQAEQTMLTDEAMIPLFYVVARNLVNPKITGWVDNIENYHRARWLCVRP